MTAARAISNEGIEFRLVARSTIGKSLEERLAIPIGLGGLAAGFVGSRYLGFGNIASLFLGVFAGFAAESYLTDKIAQPLRRAYWRHIKRREKKQKELDEEALANGAETVVFDYKGREVRCVIRPEYKRKGYTFYMSASGDVVRGAVFTYKPGQEYPFEFTFSMPDFRRYSYEELEEQRDRQIISKPVFQRAGLDFLFDANPANAVRLQYSEFLNTLVVNTGPFRHKNIRNACFEFKVTHEGGYVHTTLTYTGEDYNQALSKFASSASKIMERAARFRAEFG